MCVHSGRGRGRARGYVSRNSWAHYPLSRALCIKHRAHNRGYDLAGDRDPLLVRENHPRTIRGSPHSTALRSTSTQRARRLGGCRPLLTCFHRRTRSALSLPSVVSCFLLFLRLLWLLSIVHTALTCTRRHLLMADRSKTLCMSRAEQSRQSFDLWRL